MSDMSRSDPLPIPAEHEQHDALLVAQFAAGDPLDGSRRQEAQRLLSSCQSCVSLAADLGVLSRAVAQEPMPRRRRDFRLSAEQARDLQGNAVTRFLRGFTLPRSRAFAPAAAGIMSFGLAVVVVGYAWPDGGTIPVGSEPNALPAPIEQRAASTFAPDADVVEGEPRALTAPVDEEFLAVDEMPAGALGDDAAAAKSVDTSAREVLGAAAADAALLDEPADAVAEPAVPDILELGAAEDRAGSDVTADTAEVAPATAYGDQELEVPLPQSGRELETVLVAIGAVLALSGGLLLLLAWLARRTRDPLLR